MPKTYVISGATGMIGRAIVAKLLETDHRIIALVRPEHAATLPRHERLTVIPLALCEYAAYDPAQRADAFLHLAWGRTTGALREDADIQLKNVSYALDAVRLASRFGCTAFVGAGSQAEYGPVTVKLRGDTPADPTGGYGIAKYTAGKLTRLLAEQLSLTHCWARILSVYGPGDHKGSLINYLIDCFQRGTPPELTPCTQYWDYLFAEDAAAALLAIADRGHHGCIYPVGSGRGRPLSEYVTVIRDLVSPTTLIRFGTRPFYRHQPMYLVADIRELTAHTGFRPAYTFKAGIEKMLHAEKTHV